MPMPLAPDSAHDARALRILAKTMYRELRQNGLSREEVMAVAGDLLGLVAGEMREDRERATGGAPSAPQPALTERLHP
jgi:hypothetical protein